MENLTINKKISNFIYKDILKNEYFNEIFDLMYREYINFIFNKEQIKFIDEYFDVLRFADILSFSIDDKMQNISQQIVIILSQMFNGNYIVSLYKDKVYRNVSNFANMKFISSEKSYKFDFMNEISYIANKENNRIKNSNDIFFDTQKQLYDELYNNQFFSFSGPTSMGKTFVILNHIKRIISEGKKENFIIVVPTRALLNEVANKLITDLKDLLDREKYYVITNIAIDLNNYNFIAILTPERLYHALLNSNKLIIHQLFIDEAHKISEKDKRSIIYYKILDIIKNRDTRVYFSSPVIPNPDIYLELTNYIESEHVSDKAFYFSPVVQNKIYIDLVEREIKYFNILQNKLIKSREVEDEKDEWDFILDLGESKCNLIYVASSAKAIEYSNRLFLMIENNEISINDKVEKVIKQIETAIHKEYYLAKLLRKRLAYHIGALPAQIRIALEELIKLKLIDYCFCTSTLLEGVNVPADNLFILNHTKGRAPLSSIDAFNLMGRAGRVLLNEFGNVFLIAKESKFKNFFDQVLIEKLPNQELLPKKALKDKHKKLIIQCLLEGKTNLIEKDEEYSDKDLTEETYEYATKCLNILLNDICESNETSYIYKAFIKYLTPKIILTIKENFKDIIIKNKDNDISISANQKKNLYESIKKTNINYPIDFNYEQTVIFLKELSQIFSWDIYDKTTLGYKNKIRYYSLILLQWMGGQGIHEIIRFGLIHYKQNKSNIEVYKNNARLLIPFDDSIEHKNIVINNILRDIDDIITYKLSMYFLRFSEAIINIRGKEFLKNDWYEYIEYGTSNIKIITLQKYGFVREHAIKLINKYNQYIIEIDNHIKIDNKIFLIPEEELKQALEFVKMNFPNLFFCLEDV